MQKRNDDTVLKQPRYYAKENRKYTSAISTCIAPALLIYSNAPVLSQLSERGSMCTRNFL
jgi:hypothetical protein